MPALNRSAGSGGSPSRTEEPVLKTTKRPSAERIGAALALSLSSEPTAEAGSAPGSQAADAGGVARARSPAASAAEARAAPPERRTREAGHGAGGRWTDETR
jgi:hypothetical protein